MMQFINYFRSNQMQPHLGLRRTGDDTLERDGVSRFGCLVLEQLGELGWLWSNVLAPWCLSAFHGFLRCRRDSQASQAGGLTSRVDCAHHVTATVFFKHFGNGQRVHVRKRCDL